MFGLTKQDKDRIVDSTRRTIKNDVPDEYGDCLRLSVELIKVLHEYGIRAVIQAGSAQWKAVREELDDGVSATHFAYMWELSPQTMLCIKNKTLPEIHCWVGIPDTNEIIDISTNKLIQLAKKQANITWSAEPPPDYIWEKYDKFPYKDYIYSVDPIATMVAYRYAEMM